MIEVGLGFIATNLIVVYGLLARTSFKSSLRSLRSLLSLPRHYQLQSRDGDGTSHNDGGRTWPKAITGQIFTSAEYARHDIEVMPLTGDGIHVKQEFGSLAEGSTRS